MDAYKNKKSKVVNNFGVVWINIYKQVRISNK